VCDRILGVGVYSLKSRVEGMIGYLREVRIEGRLGRIYPAGKVEAYI